MGRIAVEDEGTHEPGPEENWQESVAFGWRDAAGGIAGFHRVGNEPNLGTSNMWCGVFTDDGDQFRWNVEDVPLARLTQPGLVCGPQSLFHDGTALRYRLETDDCAADMVVEDYGYDPNRFAAGNVLQDRIYTNHFNSNCRFRGTVRVGTRTFEVDAEGWRDHSWGPRQWGSFPVNRVFLGNFGPDFEVSFLTQVWTDGTVTKKGHVVRDGVRTEAVDSEMLILTEDDGLAARGAEVTCVLEGGERMTFRCDLVSGVICKTKQRVGFDGVGDMYYGDRRGFCLLELNNNARKGTELPSFALHTGLENGLGRRTERLATLPFAATMARERP